MAVNTQSNTLSSFYTFITNLATMGQLEAQIEEKEERLDYISNLISIYESVGTRAFADDAAIKYNRLRKEVLELKLKLNDLDRQTLLFELNSLRRE